MPCKRGTRHHISSIKHNIRDQTHLQLELTSMWYVCMYWRHLFVIFGLSKGKNRDWRQIFHSKTITLQYIFNTFLSLLFHIHLLVQALHSFLALQLFLEGPHMSLVALHLFVEPLHFLSEAQHLHPSGLFLDMTCPLPLLVVIQLEQWNFHFPSKTKNTFECSGDEHSTCKLLPCM